MHATTTTPPPAAAAVVEGSAPVQVPAPTGVVLCSELARTPAWGRCAPGASTAAISVDAVFGDASGCGVAGFADIRREAFPACRP